MAELIATATMSNVLSASATFSQVVQGAEPPTGDATVDQVLVGATFSNADEIGLTGTMPNIGQQNITPTSTDQYISEGYHNGTGVVSGAPLANAKNDIDTANEESSADLDASIALVSSNYSAIKTAIEAKSVDMTSVKPSGYADKIASIGNNYTRPSFWPELPEIAVDEDGIATEQVIYALIAVFSDNTKNLVRLTVTGAYSVDWGDGSSEVISSGVYANHRYSYDDITSEANDRGYKCVIVTITPQAGQNITGFYPSYGSSGSAYLHFRIAYKQTGSIIASICYCPMLEMVEWIGKHESIGAYNLRNSPVEKIICDFSKIKSAASIFSNNNSGQTFMPQPEIVPYTMDFSSCTNMVDAFNSFMPKHGAIYIDFNLSAAARSIIFDYCFGRTNCIEINLNTAHLISRVYTWPTSVQKLSLPGLSVTTSFANTAIGYSELKRIIENDLGTPDTTATLTITNTPDAAQIMTDIGTGVITVPAGWTIAN